MLESFRQTGTEYVLRLMHFTEGLPRTNPGVSTPSMSTMLDFGRDIGDPLLTAPPNRARAIESNARLARTIAAHPGVELAVQGGATAAIQWTGCQIMVFGTFPLFGKGGDVAMMLAGTLERTFPTPTARTAPQQAPP